MILTCPSCGRRNRSPAERLADAGRCGACKTAISPVARPIEADPEIFREVTREARVPVLVDFWAEWCGPCKLAAPEVERTAAEMAGRAIVLKVNTERYPQIASLRFRPRSKGGAPCLADPADSPKLLFS